MTRPLITLAGLLLTASLASAQNQPTPEQLRKSYDEALVQLRAAQDRKNELATENQALHKRIADLERDLAAARLEVQTLENRSYFLHIHYAAWERFLKMHESVRTMWNEFFNEPTQPAIRVSDILGDGRWPFSVGVVERKLTPANEAI